LRTIVAPDARHGQRPLPSLAAHPLRATFR
jgi:hypothetical protein